MELDTERTAQKGTDETEATGRDDTNCEWAEKVEASLDFSNQEQRNTTEQLA
jgi:hypothetical protein